MKIHPVVIQQNGIVSVTMQALFVGGANDATGQQRIEAYGDPVVQLGGQFTDPGNPSFSFPFPAAELYAGLTTQLASNTARFMTAVPLLRFPAGRHRPRVSSIRLRPTRSRRQLFGRRTHGASVSITRSV